MGRSDLIVVIPAYREACTIFDVVRIVAEIAPVVVVDDGSPDETASQARAAGATVVVNQTNLGYEESLNVGFATAASIGCDAVVTMDADGEHDPFHVTDFRMELLDNCIPLVLGVRPRKQRVAETVVSAMTRRIYGITDVFCGMKGYHMDLWRKNGGFDHRRAVGIELALAAIRGGVAFCELPVSGRPRTDEPRFDRPLRANIRLLNAYGRAMWAKPIEASV